MQSNERAVSVLATAALAATETLDGLAQALAPFNTAKAANTTRLVADPVTIAYIGYGVRDATQEIAATDGQIEGEGGEVAWMAQIISHAGTLEAECVRRFGADGFPGVFAYEIAEPFGYQFALALHRDGVGADPWVYIRQLFDDAVEEVAVGPKPTAESIGKAAAAPKCCNANIGTYNHECEAPATWSAVTLGGTRVPYCGSCKQSGHEAARATNWQRLT